MTNLQSPLLDTESVESPNIPKKSIRDFEQIEHGEVVIPDEPQSSSFSWRLLWAYTGPGWLMSIAYLDPGNLESDLQAGAYTGYQLIWVLLVSTIAGLVLQVLAARLGIVTGKNLAQICREKYPRHVSIMLWLSTELAIIGSDIQEVVGSAIAFKLLFGLPLWAGALITGLDTFTFLGLHAFGVRKLEAFFAVLIGTMCICFFADFGITNPPSGEVAKGFLPFINSWAVVQGVSIVGAVIMPHNIYLHSALVQSRDIDRARPSKIAEACKYFSIEAGVALFVSFLINLAVIAVFAAGFFKEDCAVNGQAWYDNQCQQIGLLDAGDALHAFLGNSAKIVWGIGLLAAGQSSTMTGTYAGQFVMEGFLQWNIAAWKRVAITRSMALGPALMVAFASTSNQNTGDTLDEWLNILQSIQLPFALFPVLYFTSSTEIMGDFANGKKLKAVVWFIAGCIIAINIFLIVQFVADSDNPVPHTWWFYSIVGILGCLYLTFICYLLYLSQIFHRIRDTIRGWMGYHVVHDDGMMWETLDDEQPIKQVVA